MSTADDEKLNARLERELPRLLANQSYDYRQELAAFRAEEADLEAEIDRVWEKTLKKQAPAAAAPRRLPQWWGAAAAVLVASAGLAGVVALNRMGAPADAPINTLPNPNRPFAQVLAAELQKQWQPAAGGLGEAGGNLVVSGRPAPAGAPPVLAIEQSSGSLEIDRAALEALARALESTGSAPPQPFTVTFDPAARQVNVRQ
ncbi:hypothetical protein [Gloeobacter violaceus]|uniref:Glr1231 protein n=1 Tax=Gloeobacter violaceus (strain ATCC 29082 / PCC 7421) TaxID=251221 RepID=Q7NL95_GLOVI|nr:hypothetical protein [Gloeobacter violaceus]BAC89172.1 glr1231 [Gloeobacter violaceus PCC 7421]